MIFFIVIQTIPSYTIKSSVSIKNHLKSQYLYANTVDEEENNYQTQQHYNTQIYCNVELNTDYIEAVGFDMDFTLAQVNNEYNRFNNIILILLFKSH